MNPAAQFLNLGRFPAGRETTHRTPLDVRDVIVSEPVAAPPTCAGEGCGNALEFEDPPWDAAYCRPRCALVAEFAA